MKTIKTIYNMINLKSFLIFITGIGLQISVSFAHDSGNPKDHSILNENFCILCLNLAPVAPAEAIFEGYSEGYAVISDFSFLAPETPKEADFSDSDVETSTYDIINLAPVAPAEADFDDTEPDLTPDFSFLAPVAPAEADFE